ncbi:MAG: glycosyltransferase family protein [Rhodospirillaceae bacterium]|jgi:spore coat polysaccharide biosynthesis protein SpsF|nr:glycosyltransferase family protein [Rhodospirillaceae bacterium]MBT6117647.1 glycosyltransferase family protein [Rhodospirillaceae bacterium]
MTGRGLRNICITVEARMTSSRFPGKMLEEIGGTPALQLMMERVARTPSADKVILATTTNATDDPLVELAESCGFGWHRGSEPDVLQRVLDTARTHDVDAIVELTGDCVFMDPAVVEAVIQRYLASDADYVCNFLEETYPSGMQAQIYRTAVLEDVARRTQDPDDREHVSLFIYRNPQIYKVENLQAPEAHRAPKINLTLDWREDLDLMREVWNGLVRTGGDGDFGVAEIIDLFRRRPELLEINAHRARTAV